MEVGFIGVRSGPEEIIKCKVCDKKHKKRGCGYKCKHCGMLGSHKEKNCWKAFPHLKGQQSATSAQH